jgi:hypothetical protein
MLPRRAVSARAPNPSSPPFARCAVADHRVQPVKGGIRAGGWHPPPSLAPATAGDRRRRFMPVRMQEDQRGAQQRLARVRVSARKTSTSRARLRMSASSPPHSLPRLPPAVIGGVVAKPEEQRQPDPEDRDGRSVQMRQQARSAGPVPRLQDRDRRHQQGDRQQDDPRHDRSAQRGQAGPRTSGLSLTIIPAPSRLPVHSRRIMPSERGKSLRGRDLPARFCTRPARQRPEGQIATSASNPRWSDPAAGRSDDLAAMGGEDMVDGQGQQRRQADIAAHASGRSDGRPECPTSA